MDWKIFTREKFKYTNEKESLRITYAQFFPTFTLTGFCNSILLGAQSIIIFVKDEFLIASDGVILKFNDNKPAEGDYQISTKFHQGFNKIISEE